jgi:ferredoxin
MKAYKLKSENLNSCIQSIIEIGDRVIGPVRAGKMTLFSRIKSPEDLILEKDLTTKSAKGVFFPQSEPILRYKKEGSKVTVEDVEHFAPQTVLLGVKPCDAAALDILDSVFNWDYKDKFYNQRRENTTIVTYGCKEAIDDVCFCSSVGLGPDSRIGSDVFMIEDNAGGYYLEAVTEKGEKLLSTFSDSLKETEVLESGALSEEVPVRFDAETIKPWLDDHFNDDFWKEMSLKCVGCGTCSFICPTCHCFDIVDETRLGEGVRLKNWDSCQFSLFTAHASGHNPRNVQSERYRQRLMHKFKYYIEKFDRTLCVGCGRCVRACPVGHSILDYLTEIEKRSKQEAEKSNV